MTNRRTGFIAAAALAIGLAIGAVGSTAAANPTTPPGHHSMMGGSFAPGSSFGPGMMGGSMMGGSGIMGNLSDADRQKLLERCDEVHDAMHSALGASPAPSASPAPKS